MPTILWGFCLLLALSSTGSRPAAGNRKESPDSSTWWNQASLPLQRQAIARREANDLAGAEQLYFEGYREALRRQDPIAQVKFLISAGSCELLAFRYQAALETFLKARGIAAAIQDGSDLGAIAVNLSSVYLQVWDTEAALRSAEDGLRAVKDAAHSYYGPYLLLQLGRLHGVLGDGQAEAYFSEAIEAARANGNQVLESQAWDLLGEERFASGRLTAAEAAYSRAHYIRILTKARDIGVSYGYLGGLKLAQGDLKSASHLTRLAVRSSKAGMRSLPPYILRHQEGEVALASGRVDEALRDFSDAIEASSRWRMEALPARSSLTKANIAIEERIFRSFIDLAAAHALAAGSSRWAARALQAVEVNRAASLRESVALADAWKRKLPAEYWDILGKLAAEEAKSLTGEREGDSVGRLRLKITELEAEAGIQIQFNNRENFRTQTSLNHFQSGLHPGDLFLCFKLGDRQSYLWAMSRSSLHLYRLPPVQRISGLIRELRLAISRGGTAATKGSRGSHGDLKLKDDFVRKATQLYGVLFGQLSAEERSKTFWLLSLEGPLFDLPFAALVEEDQGGNTVYLVQRHSIQITPGGFAQEPAGQLEGTASDVPARPRKLRSGDWFLGVADPVYNAADLRLHTRFPWTTTEMFGWFRLGSGSAEASSVRQLGRLVGSAEEVESSAQVWRAEGGSATVLQGPEARRERLLNLLRTETPEREPKRPAVIHLATHVLSSPEAPEIGFIALGQDGPGNGPGMLSTTEIAGLDVRGALITMTGCGSGLGQAVPGAGLLGLTRAWLMAGARSVLATVWPVEDSAGEVLAGFYHHLPGNTPARALQLSQMETLKAGGWRSEPRYWASYQITGGVR